jgi:hypothetical protein
MSFLAPWALLLAAAAGVPLVLHLLRRRTGTKFDFPAVRYLLRAQKEHAREVKLRNLLLMLLRIGIVVAIAMAAARPIGPLPGLGHAPTAVAILLDNSRSTTVAGADGPAFGTLVAAARRIVDGTGSSDQAWIVTLDGAVIGGSADVLRDGLARLQPIDGAGDADAALRRAAALVKGSGLPAGRVIVLTDGQATTWGSIGASALDGVSATVHRVPGEPPANRAVASVATEPAHWNPRGAVRATITGTDSTSWRVLLDGRTAARGSVLPGAAILARLQPAARGWVAGAIELAPDELRGDDLRHFAVHLGEPPVVSLDAASGAFLRASLEALVAGGRAVRGEGVVLTSAERARRPGLIFAPADPLKLADANRALAAAGIPWRFGARRDGPAPLRGDGLDGAVVRTWYPLLPATGTSVAAGVAVDTIARVGGAPWAVGGDGYVLVASAAVPEATDLTVRAAFVPWLDALLSQRLAQGTGAAVEVAPGEATRVPNGVDVLEAPDGTTVPVVAGSSIDAPWTAGVHFWRRGTARAGALVVNGEPAESDLTRLDEAALAAQLGAEAEADAGALAGAAFSASGRRFLDGTLLVLALVLLAAEAVVARGGFRTRTA